MPEDRPDEKQTGRTYTEEEFNKRVQDLADAKVKALEEKREFERQKQELEKQRAELEQWKSRYVEATKQKPQQQPQTPAQTKTAEEAFKGLTPEQQINLYKDYEQRQYEIQLANFKNQVKAHIHDNVGDLSHLGKLDDVRAFRQITDKMNDHKAATGQDLSIVDAAKMADNDIKTMVEQFTAKEETKSEFDLDKDPSYNPDKDIEKLAPTPNLTQELEESGSPQKTGDKTDLGKLPNNEQDFTKQVFKESITQS